MEGVGFSRKPPVHDLRHCWHTNSVRSSVHLLIVDAIVGHGNNKKAVQSLYLSISDDDLVRAIDMTKFDIGETERWVKK